MKPAQCQCSRMIVDTLEETLTCPGRWYFAAGIGWCHVLAGAR